MLGAGAMRGGFVVEANDKTKGCTVTCISQMELNGIMPDVLQATRRLVPY